MEDDSALEDFLSRFGDPDKARDPLKPVSQLKPAGFSRSTTEGLNFPVNELKSSGLAEMATSKIKAPNISNSLNNKMSSIDNTDKISGLGKVKNIGGKALSAAPSAISLIDNVKGGQFDTSANSDGPGKSGGAIIQGASQGAEFGKALGGGPITQGAGALVGGLISTFAHTGAMKKFRKNQVKKNLSENALEKSKREEGFAMSEGLASMENLKALRQKQLGVIG